MVNSKIAERSAILALLPPLAATTARTSAFVKADVFGRLRAVCLVGDASATGALTLIKAGSSTGANSAAVASAVIGGASSAGDDMVHVMEVLPSDLDDDPDRPWYAVSLGAVALTAVIMEGFDPRYGPPTQGTFVTLAR